MILNALRLFLGWATTLAYYTAGDLTNDHGTAYTWDAEGKMTTAAASGGSQATYVYNALGERVEKKVDSVTTACLTRTPPAT